MQRKRSFGQLAQRAGVGHDLTVASVRKSAPKRTSAPTKKPAELAGLSSGVGDYCLRLRSGQEVACFLRQRDAPPAAPLTYRVNTMATGA